MKTYQYISSSKILNLVNNFNLYLNTNGVEDFNDSKNKNLRSLMIDYFKSKPFQNDYFEMVNSIATRLGISQSTLLLQKTPTPRIFRPNDHGTSFHTDYWYGHGEKTITIWTPLSVLENGNSFSIVPDQRLNEIFSLSLSKTKGVASLKQEKELLDISDTVMAPLGESIVFNSKILHGSPKNLSSKTRVSFDFRIADSTDRTSSKDPESYFNWANGTFAASKNRFSGLKFIKYICGGENKSTLAQHLLIESVVKEYGICVVGQEAEAERFGHPIFRAYLENLAGYKKIDGIIVASKTVLDQESVDYARKFYMKIYFCLENELL